MRQYFLPAHISLYKFNKTTLSWNCHVNCFLTRGEKKEKQFLRGNVQMKLKFLSNFSSDYNILITITTFLLCSKSVKFFSILSPLFLLI